jgi:hypothetical protein
MLGDSGIQAGDNIWDWVEGQVMGWAFLLDGVTLFINRALEHKANWSKEGTRNDLVAVFGENQQPSFSNLSLNNPPHVISIHHCAFVVAPGGHQNVVLDSLILCKVLQGKVCSVGEVEGDFGPEGVSTKEWAEK